MSTYRSIKTYRAEATANDRQRFLTQYPFPVLLTHGGSAETGPGYFTRPQTGTLKLGASYASRIGFTPNDSFIVIPVVKAEGRPFPERIGVGRTRATDIILVSSDISKYHAYFSYEDNRWVVTDADSSNGTFVQGTRIAPRTPTPLTSGALLAFGGRLHMFMTAADFFDFL